MSYLWYKEQADPAKTHEASFGNGTNIHVSLLRLLKNNIITVKSHIHKPWYKPLCFRFYVAVGKEVIIILTSKLIIQNKLHGNYVLNTNLMHWLLLVYKILFSSTCFEPQVLIFRRIRLYTCSIWYCHSLWEFLVACRYTAWVRTDVGGGCW